MFTLTEEQQEIISAVKNTDDNIIINAYAGAAKTSTLVLMAEAMPSQNILCLAFNKSIEVEMNQRLPDNAQAKTLNSLGHRVWANAIAPKLKLEKSKTYSNTNQLIGEWSDEKEQEHLYARMSELMRIIDVGSQSGYVPLGHFPRANRIYDCTDFFLSIDDELEDYEQELIRQVTVMGIEQAFKGIINFNDQIFMPTIFRGKFPKYPVIMVDEAQDLSLLNHVMLGKLVSGKKPSRLIAVGDSCQAIYGFRGANENSMELLANQFSMEPYKLTISFRCPKAVTEHARWRAPDMRSPENAIQGRVQDWSTGDWSVTSFNDGSAVICRNNAPLFRMAIKMLQNGMYPELIGNDISQQLIKQLKKWRPRKKAALSRDEVLYKIEHWEITQKKKTRAKKAVSDKANCLRIFAEQGETLDEIISYAETLSRMRGNIKLMTGHKAKGLEFKSVFFLDEELISDKDQDPNVRYVIQTRAEEELIYITSDSCIELAEPETEEAVA